MDKAATVTGGGASVVQSVHCLRRMRDADLYAAMVGPSPTEGGCVAITAPWGNATPAAALASARTPLDGFCGWLSAAYGEPVRVTNTVCL